VDYQGQGVNFYNCMIIKNIKDGIKWSGAKIDVKNCTIANNGEVGMHMTYYGDMKIENSVISDNAIGVQSKLYVSNVVVHSCNIVGNRTAIDVNTKQEFKCENNYWGTVKTQQIMAGFSDSRTKPDVGAVIFEPFEKKSITDAGCTLKMVR
jgi:hypothetical protein